MNKNKLLILSIFTVLGLAACGKGDNITSEVTSNTIPNTTENGSSSVVITTPNETSTQPLTTPEVVNKYVVVWKNYDGSVLETDEDVLEGTIPTYDGATPTKAKTDEDMYVFSGWTPAISEVYSNQEYTATFDEINIGDIDINANPVISDDGKTVQYGIYPQTVVSDSALISNLNSLEPASSGWYIYDSNYYTKVTSSVYNNEEYTFNNGDSIINGNEYWFKCEPITWNVLNNNNGEYTLLSSLLLDNHKYYKDYSNRIINGETVLANNYSHSDIRSWLNNEFYNKAFFLNNAFIQSVSIDNNIDKVYLPSYEDYLNSNYGFDSQNGISLSRQAKTTDYSRVLGSWYSKDSGYEYNGTYWTRSASKDYSYCAWNVNSGGYISEYAIDGNSHSVRPCIKITIA